MSHASFTPKRRNYWSAVLIIGLFLAFVACPAAARALRFITDSFADEPDAVPGDGVCADSAGSCTLRAAIEEANADRRPTLITLAHGEYALTSVATTGGLHVTGYVWIRAARDGRPVLSGSNQSRLFDIAPGARVRISGVTLQNGRAALGGAIRNRGLLALADCSITANSASTGGGIANAGILQISRCTISNNSASHAGGGIANFGRAILTNVTVSGNSARVGGGLRNESAGRAWFNNTTVADNAAGSGGGGIVNTGDIRIWNTLIADNDARRAADCFGALLSGGHNLIEDPAGCRVRGSRRSNLLGLDPLLGPLQENGGPTSTHALLPGSPAIDAGNPTRAIGRRGACSRSDQRHLLRPQGSACDIGAYEVQP